MTGLLLLTPGLRLQVGCACLVESSYSASIYTLMQGGILKPFFMQEEEDRGRNVFLPSMS